MADDVPPAMAQPLGDEPDDASPDAAAAEKSGAAKIKIPAFEPFPDEQNLHIRVDFASTPCKDVGNNPVHQVWIDCARAGETGEFKVTYGARGTEVNRSVTTAAIEITVTSTPPPK
jgi:hypothetical protein